ncbi:hypothetical protein BD779DRAFT_1434895 [Infundibulicybe gibba]|nr:hypothetical protein BD779DRAFT_1434895 [Infundibulicybe gibba]
MEVSAAHTTDVEQLVRHDMSRGYQIFSLITPPAYIAFILTRRGRGALSINRVLRATWVGGLSGSAACGGFAYTRHAFANEESVRKRRFQAAYDTNRIRAEDHATIGGVLMAVLTPALLWKQARIIHLILGGASFGSGIGFLFHQIRALAGDPPPTVEIPDIAH